MRKFFMTSLMCFSLLAPSVVLAAQDGGKKDEDSKKEKKECKDDSCKKPEK